MKQKKVSFLVLFVLGLVSFLGLSKAAIAAQPGDRIVKSDGTIFQIRKQKRNPFPSPAVYFSHGYKFSDEGLATGADLALETGSVVSYAEGALVKDAGPTVYIISESKKRPFVSAQIFLELGYSFTNVLTDESGFLDTVSLGESVSTSLSSHPPGTLINSNGTVYLVTSSGRKGISSVNVFDSYKFDFSKVVLANSYDLLLLDEGLIGSSDSPSESEQPEAPEEPQTPEPVITNQSPTVPTKEGVKAGFPKKVINFSFTASDPEGEDIVYLVDWGDGASTQSSVVSSGTKFTTSHDWQYVDDYTVIVTATDISGNSSESEFVIQIGLDPTQFGPAVTVISPNGGEEFIIGSVVEIKWEWNWVPLNTDQEVTIFFRQGSSLNREIVKNNKLQTYSWVVSGQGVVAGNNYKIIVLSEGSPGAGVAHDDSSDSDFSLKN